MRNEIITPEQRFIQTCAEWSARWRRGDVNKLDAVDHLHNVAVAWGLIAVLDQDAVQEIMLAHFQDDERDNGSQTKSS